MVNSGEPDASAFRLIFSDSIQDRRQTVDFRSLAIAATLAFDFRNIAICIRVPTPSHSRHGPD